MRTDIKRILILILCLSLLSSCAVIGAATLPEVQGEKSGQFSVSFGACRKGQAEEQLLDATAIAATLYGPLQSAFKSYLQRKEARFRSTYATKSYVNRISAGECFRLQRVAEDNSLLMDMEVLVERRGSRALQMRVTNVEIQRFSASSSPKEDESLSAQVTVSAIVTFINDSSVSGPGPITTVEVPIASWRYTLGSQLSTAFSKQPSRLFPDPQNRPVNIGFSVTEVGDGAGELASAVKGYDANSDALKSILGLD